MQESRKANRKGWRIQNKPYVVSPKGKQHPRLTHPPDSSGCSFMRVDLKGYDFMNKKRLKVTVHLGCEERFIEFCERSGINYKQYPMSLKTRFGVDDSPMLRNFDGIKSIEDMPTVTLE